YGCRGHSVFWLSNVLLSNETIRQHMSHARPSPTQRQGASIVFVLCMIALTLGASYAIVRSEMSSVRIQQNSGRRGLARQAAMQGLSVAMRKMQESGWS